MSYIERCQNCDELYPCWGMQGAKCVKPSPETSIAFKLHTLKVRLSENMQSVADYALKVEALESALIKTQIDLQACRENHEGLLKDYDKLAVLYRMALRTERT